MHSTTQQYLQPLLPSLFYSQLETESTEPTTGKKYDAIYGFKALLFWTETKTNLLMTTFNCIVYLYLQQTQQTEEKIPYPDFQLVNANALRWCEKRNPICELALSLWICQTAVSAQACTSAQIHREEILQIAHSATSPSVTLCSCADIYSTTGLNRFYL